MVVDDGITLYDTAILEKFKRVFPNTFFTSTDVLFNIMGEHSQLPIRLPAINIFNLGYEVEGQLFNMPEMRSGRPISYRDASMADISKLQSLPIRIDYQVDVTDNNRIRINGIMKELLFWLYREPILTIEDPYLKNKFDFNIQVEGGISDTSDLMSFADRGRIYRNTINLAISFARLFMSEDVKSVLETVVEEYYEEELVSSKTYKEKGEK